MVNIKLSLYIGDIIVLSKYLTWKMDAWLIYGYFPHFLGIQRLLNFGDICLYDLRDMGYFGKHLKGYGILGTPFPGPRLCFSLFHR